MVEFEDLNTSRHMLRQFSMSNVLCKQFLTSDSCLHINMLGCESRAKIFALLSQYGSSKTMQTACEKNIKILFSAVELIGKAYFFSHINEHSKNRNGIVEIPKTKRSV